MLTIQINGKPTTVNAEPDTPLLWVLRGELQLTGTKFGCGMALCGACTVYIDGEPVRACVTPIAAVGARAVTTIEGLQGKAADAVGTPAFFRACLSSRWRSDKKSGSCHLFIADETLLRPGRPRQQDVMAGPAQ